MDITPTNANTPTPKSPEADTETPTRIQSAKPISFTNGVLKRHHPAHHHLHHHPVVITYKECLKNHAATLGGHALDGCGEFMPSPSSNPSDPTSLKCAACGCHRNFHRRDPEDPPSAATATTTAIEYQPHHRHHPPPPPSHRSPNSASPPPISSSYYPSAPHMLLALSGSGLPSHPDNNYHSNNHMGANSNINLSSGGIASLSNQNPGSRKRFRTKFSQFQKEKMLEFAERVGWKMQKRDDEVVQEFCSEVGVDKGVLKVWMHNNKNTFGKRDINGGGGGARSGNVDNTHNSDNNDNCEDHNDNDDNNNNGNNCTNIAQSLSHHLFENDTVAHVGTNGSSSSS